MWRKEGRKEGRDVKEGREEYERRKPPSFTHVREGRKGREGRKEGRDVKE